MSKDLSSGTITAPHLPTSKEGLLLSNELTQKE
jgi:hypothetical protein